MSPQYPTRIPLIHNHGLHITLHNTQNVGPIKLLLPTTICFGLLLFNIAQILYVDCFAEPLIVPHRLGDESDGIEERFASEETLLAVQIVRCTLLQNHCIFLKT